MPRQRCRSVIELEAPRAVSEQEETELTFWKPVTRAIEVYEYLRANPGDLKISSLAHRMSMSHNTVYTSLEWLRYNNFIREEQTQSKRTIIVQPVPEFEHQPQQQTIGIHSIPMCAPNGVKCHSNDLSRDELSQLSENLTSVGYRHTDRALAVYDFLRKSPFPFFRYELASVTDGSYFKAAAALRALEQAHLIVQEGGAVAVFPVQPKETLDMFVDEIQVTLKSPKFVEITKSVRAERATSDYTKLFTLYRALVEEAGLEANPTARDKIAIVNLLKQYSYATIRPALVMFMLRPEFFTKLSDKIERYGRTLSTFQFNFASIEYALEDIRRQYPVNKDGFWHDALRGDLEKFRYD